MRYLKSILILLACMTATVSVMAQTDRQYIREGNRLFRKGAFNDAELKYQKALSVNENNIQAIYNLGCAAMQQGNDSVAVRQFEKAGRMENNKIRKAMAYHNIGVVMQTHQQYDKAIEAYKEALRNNPNDMETRYNLELCRRQIKQDKQDQNNNGGGKGDNKDKDEKKDDKQQNKDQNKDNKDQKQNQQDKQDQDKQQQQQDQQMSKENAQRLLDAAVQEEKRTQDKLQKALQQPRRKNLQKNW